MYTSKHKIIFVGLAFILALVACSPVATATPTVQVIPNTAVPTIPAVTYPPMTTIPPFPVISSPSIQSLDMLDVNNGWALTDTAVARTTDGGSSWCNVSPDSLNGALASSFFLDANTGWVAIPGTDPTNGILFHTANGGLTWTTTPVPFGGGSIKFVDPWNGWEMARLSAGMSHEAVAIFRTSDGGTTWSQVLINDPTASGSSDSLPLTGDKNGITALDSNHGWVTGAQPSSDFIYIYNTQDGGTTWSHQNLSLPADYSGAMTSAALPVFFGPNQAVLPVLLFANNNGSDFYVSQDSGQTWKVTTPVAQGGFLAVASTNDFFVWDGSTPLNVSHDSGASWSTVSPNIDIKDNMVSLQFVNATTGWALTSNANSHHSLYKTADGGKTWVSIIP
ncbi:MAG: YCF48-related protein [Anaerolineales bacterium]